MSVTTTITLTTNIAAVPGVGPKRAEAFRRLGIFSVAHLLRHLPVRHERDLGEHSVAVASEHLTPIHGANATLAVRGEILTVRMTRARQPRFEATLFDGTGTILLTWFNAGFLRHKIHPGLTIRASGKAQRYGDTMQMVNPRWEAIKPEHQAELHAARWRPVYPAAEDLPSSQIDKAVIAILEPALQALPDHLSVEFRQTRALPTLADAYRMVHTPADEEEVGQGRRRLAYDELLFLQLGVMLKRRHRRASMKAIALKRTDAIDRHILARLPFDLTASQRVVIEEMVGDLAREVPMNRLLQGDVGAGKTVIALYAMLLAAAAGHQAALLAPTELLAEQHFSTFSRLLDGSRVRIELLTGSLSAVDRRRANDGLADGSIGLIIGTHALLTESTRFKSLAVAMIDEQHRFGVHQRAMLRSRSDDAAVSPHTLVMTATPIPRTLSLTIFGDLDVSTINGLPPGRMPVATRVVAMAQRDEVYGYIAGRLSRGEQAYIVVPVIDESETGLTDVHTHHEWLAGGHFHGRRLAILHGRMSREQRDGIMDAFRRCETDALIATTIIEVGVDVPNASIMVVEHAERFGLAQLHQLRGRVGRGSRRSVCILAGDATTEEAKARLEAVASTNDGFAIAEKDFEIRGPGDLFGTRQSGEAPFHVVEFPRDTQLLQMARRDAQAWIDASPKLDRAEDELLRKRLLKAHGAALGLGDVAELHGRSECKLQLCPHDDLAIRPLGILAPPRAG